MISVHATKSRFTLWTAIALLTVIGALWGLPQSALAAPDRPTGLTATALDHDTVSLTWSHPAAENVDHYQILRRSADQGRLSQVATTQTTSFQDDGLQPRDDVHISRQGHGLRGRTQQALGQKSDHHRRRANHHAGRPHPRADAGTRASTGGQER